MPTTRNPGFSPNRAVERRLKRGEIEWDAEGNLIPVPRRIRRNRNVR